MHTVTLIAAMIISGLPGVLMDDSCTISTLDRSVTNDGRQAVTVVVGLTESLDHPVARAMVVRPPGPREPSVLVMTDQTTPADLARALVVVAESYRRHGQILDRELRTYVLPAPESWGDADGRIGAMLDQVRVGPRGAPDRFGVVRAVAFDLSEVGGRLVPESSQGR